MGPVRLCNGLQYLSYRVAPSESTSLIECPYQLAAGEEVKRVYWEMWNGTDQVGAYEWDPVSRGHGEHALPCHHMQVTRNTAH